MTTIYSKSHGSLLDMGWSPFFQQQLTLEEWDSTIAVRVVAQHRSYFDCLSEQGYFRLNFTPNMPTLTVGDWLLVDRDLKFIRCLERLSLFSRRSAGSEVSEQYIAANIDTVFIVSSLNQDFNLNRIERYLVVAKEAGVEPVIVLTKADLCEDVDSHVEQIRELDSMLVVETINALEHDDIFRLHAWCRKGTTITLLGSSGVGKSTIVNGLLNETTMATGDIRESDAKGRHTTTARVMSFMSSGGVLIDTPGMRELQLADCERGINDTFADIEQLAQQCKFSNCQHTNEPQCQVQSAIERGDLTERRLHSYRKLKREQAINGATLAERRARDKSLSKMYRTVQSSARQMKQDGN